MPEILQIQTDGDDLRFQHLLQGGEEEWFPSQGPGKKVVTDTSQQLEGPGMKRHFYIAFAPL
jgi:hypothetical protein